LRKVDDYLSANYLKKRYEKKLKFARDQYENSFSVGESAKKYQIEIENELGKYNQLYKIKEEEIKEENLNFWKLSENHLQKKEKFNSVKESSSRGFFNKFYDIFSFKKTKKRSKNINQRLQGQKKELDYSLIKSEYKNIKKQVRSQNKYMNRSFKNLIFLKRKLISLNEEKFKIENITQEVSSSKTFYKDYLVYSIQL